MNTMKQHNVKTAIASLVLLAGMGAAQAAQAAQDITQAEAEHINAELAPVANPEANMEKVGTPPEDPAAVVGTRFTYQGTLRLNNNRADGPYDFRFRLYNQAAGGAQLGGTVTRNDLPVTDGLFATELDFGQTPIDGDDIFLQIEVRDGASAGAYTVLSPRQRINATPYAVRALLGGDAGGGSSPWTVSGTTISYAGGRVNMGTGSPNAFVTINAPSSETDLFRVRRNGSTKLKVSDNGGVSIGLGADANTPPNDGLTVFGATHLRGNLFFPQDQDGIVFPGTTGATPGPMITMFATGTNNADRMVIQHSPGFPNHGLLYKDSSDEFVFKRFSNVLTLGSNITAHKNIKQPFNRGGALKAAVHMNPCGGASGTTATIARQYNGTDSPGTITAVHNGNGKCTITFPFAINNRFWVANALNGPGNSRRAAMCDIATNTKLSCARWNTQTGAHISSKIMLLVY